MHLPFFILALSSALLIVQAHPGHDIEDEIEQRAKALGPNPRDISHCATKLKTKGHEDRTISRRSAILQTEREKRGLPTNPSFIKARSVDALREGRDSWTVLNADHSSPVTYTPQTDPDTIFAGNQSCILVPEVTEGPFYVSGEYIRSDVRERVHAQGVDLILDIQVIDVSTCQPVPNTMIDLWYANSTGVYSGVVASGNGNSADTSNMNTTHSRGLQPTDNDGVAQFTAFYPGHYGGRTHHIHVATHVNGTILPNNTFLGTTVSHIGQIFFDQALSARVESIAPYSSNTQPVTPNARDGIFRQAASIGDPVVGYSLLGANVEDGIFAWIAFGIDVSRQEPIRAVGAYRGSGDAGGTDPLATSTPSSQAATALRALELGSSLIALVVASGFLLSLIRM